MRSLTVLALALVSACGSRTTSSGDGAAEARVVAETGVKKDLPVQDASDKRLLFRLSVPASESKSIFIYSFTEQGLYGWLTVEDAASARVRLEGHCEICTCPQCSGCPICGMGASVVNAIAPGRKQELALSPAAFWKTSTCGGTGTCAEQKPWLDGSYSASFCWSLSSTGVGTNQKLIDPIICKKATFSWPADHVVEAVP